MSQQQPPMTIAAPSANGEVVVLLPRIEDLSKFVTHGPANVETASRTIDYDMTTLAGAEFSDSHGFPENEYNRETRTLSSLAELVEAGQTFVSVLYPYRSTARALPQPAREAGEDEAEYKARMVRYHQIAFTILYPEIDKLSKVMFHCYMCITTLRQHFEHIVLQEVQKNVQSHPFMDLFIHVLNNLFLLNSLINFKGSIGNDFSAYKRSFTSIRASLDDVQAQEIGNKSLSLQFFLNNLEHPKDFILHLVRQSIQSIEGFDLGLAALFDHIKESVENSRWLYPDTELVYLRIIPLLYYLMDSPPKDKNKKPVPKDPQDLSPQFPAAVKEINVFKLKTIDHNHWKKILRLKPVLPLYGDMHLSIIHILRTCPHWDDQAMASDWVSDNAKEIKRIGDAYLLVQHHEIIRSEYNKFMSDFAALLSETRAFRESKKSVTPVILHRVLELVLAGLKIVSRWTGLVQYQCAWKYAHPITEIEYKKLRSANGDSEPLSGDPSAYEKAVRYNYTQRELHVLIDVIGMIKGVGSVMLENELTITPLLNRSIHDNCQIFLQTEVARPLRKAWKNQRKDVESLLLQIREIGGDWFDYAKQKDDYFKPKKELLQVNRDFPRRPTAPSATQLALIRRMIHMVWSPKASGMKGGFLSKKNLKDEWLVVWQDFYNKSFHYQYLLNYGSTIKQVTDLSFLWFHEFYLEVTGCVQFPIASSIPWVMTDYLIKNRNMKDNIFFLFDIYNDAASKSLRVLKQQFLYQEIEAELNLAFEQLLYCLSTDVFTYYKTVAGSMLIDKQYKAKYESAKQTDDLTVRLVRYKSIISQTRVSLLGRTLDVTLLVAEHCNRLLKENVQIAIRRFESQDFSAIVELSRLFKHIKLTHKLLSKFLVLDPLHQLFRECDESVGLCQFRSRIMTHAFTELVADIFPRFVFNSATNRFVKSPEFTKDEVNPEVARENAPRKVPGYMWFGQGFKDAYDRENQLFRGFIGIEHCIALLDVMAVGQEHMLAREITEDLVTKFISETLVYLETIQIASSAIKPASLQLSTPSVYSMYEARLKQISSWAPLRVGLFAKVTEMGNSLAFLMLFEDAMHVNSHFVFQTETFFNGVRPIPPHDPSMPPLSEAHQELFIREYNEPGKLPYVDHITQQMTSLWNTTVSNNFSKMTHFNQDNQETHPVTQITKHDWFAPPFVHNKVHEDTGVVIQNVIDNAHASGYNLLLRPTHNPASITSAALARMVQACEDGGLTAKLSCHGQLWQHAQEQITLENPAPPQRVIDLEHGRELARIVSALFFIYNQSNLDRSGPKWGWETKATSKMLGDSAIYGHGFILGLASMLHVFGERYRFEMVDFTNIVLRADLINPCPREVQVDKKTNQVQDTLIPEVLKFIKNAVTSKEIMANFLNILESFCPAPTPDLLPLDPLNCIPRGKDGFSNESILRSSMTALGASNNGLNGNNPGNSAQNTQYNTLNNSFNHEPSISRSSSHLPNNASNLPPPPMGNTSSIQSTVGSGGQGLAPIAPPVSSSSGSTTHQTAPPSAPRAPMAPMAPVPSPSNNASGKFNPMSAPPPPGASGKFNPMSAPPPPGASGKFNPMSAPPPPGAPAGWDHTVSIEQNYDYGDDAGTPTHLTHSVLYSPQHRDTAYSFGGINEEIIQDDAAPVQHFAPIGEDYPAWQPHDEHNQYGEQHQNQYGEQNQYDQWDQSGQYDQSQYYQQDEQQQQQWAPPPPPQQDQWAPPPPR